MNESPLNRWNPGIAIRRWRVPLIAVLLIAIAIGVLLEGLAYLRAQEAKCVIQYRGNPAMSLDDMQHLILSDAFLEEARLKVGSGFSPSTVKKLVRCEPIKGTSLLIISARGRHTPDKRKLCNALADLLQTRAIASIEHGFSNVRLEKENAVISLENEVETQRQRLAELMRDDPGLLTDQPTYGTRSAHSPELENALEDIRKNLRKLERARGDLISALSRIRCFSSPVEIHEPAGPPRPIAFAEILPCALRLSTWIGSGFIAVLILAFLLEAMRRTPQKPVIHE